MSLYAYHGSYVSGYANGKVYSYLINEHFVCSIFHHLQITLNQGRDLYFMNNKDQERYLFAFWRNKLPD
jgi:hypothetical protein